MSTQAILPPRAGIAAYLLAGGASTRMGQCKARLDLDGEPLVRHLARALAPWVQEVVVVAKPSQGLEDLGLPLLFDATQEHALVHGIRTALQAPGPEWRLLCACDMPGVGPEVLQRLWRSAHAGAGSYMRLGERDEPLPSLWRAEVGRRITPEWGLVARDWLRHAGLLACRLDAPSGALWNVNTPAEWQRYRDGRGERP